MLEESGAGYVGLRLVSEDLISDVVALHEQGSRLGEPEAGERARPGGRAVRWRVASLPAADPEFSHLFLTEHDPSGGEWTAQDRAERARQEHPLGGPVAACCPEWFCAAVLSLSTPFVSAASGSWSRLGARC